MTAITARLALAQGSLVTALFLSYISAAAAAELPPVERSQMPIGTKLYGKRNGEDVHTELIARSGGLETLRTSRGCTYKLRAGEFATPPLEWNDGCGGASGSRTVTRSGDD